ncbi:MAG: hypothetical protein ACFFDQ_07665, partial [Candidatus Thorarchaeota archaeon]
GPIAGFEYAMESRDVFDSIHKCGRFLHEAYEEGTIVLTNENGPWYVEWYGLLHLNVSSISVDSLNSATNITELVLDTIAERHVQVIVVFERLSYSLLDTYSLLHSNGYLELIRSYSEVGGWRSIIYETDMSIR